MDDLRINGPRLLADLAALSRFGSTGDGGVNRPALSENHLAARTWLRERILAAGLDFRLDAAGNHSGLLRCGPEGAATLLLGSHLDSVPNGGRFDGALGVVAALEVVRTVLEAGLQLTCHLEAIDFTDEEGTLFGLFGSRAVAGLLTETDLANPRGGLENVQPLLARAGILEPLAARRDPAGLAGYLEVHIEQGPHLLATGADIGIVSALVGISSFRLVFSGRADHAGTTPMDARRDAGLGAATFILGAHELVLSRFPGTVINFGNSRFHPGAFNIVPDRAELALEFRAAEQETLDAMERGLMLVAEETALVYGLELAVERQGCVAPAPAAASVRAAFGAACESLGLKSIDLVSGAGHDTQALASVCPAGMIFIPSTGGSHNPNEFAEDAACVNGANAVLHAVLAGWGDR